MVSLNRHSSMGGVSQNSKEAIFHLGPLKRGGVSQKRQSSTLGLSKRQGGVSQKRQSSTVGSLRRGSLPWVGSLKRGSLL